ncbi:MAG: hypothetical protein QOD77_1766 [Thermoplasmata archaeon]|jgi:hypothetical protein|nr:hypothetical protein [Thermoplasmata archaeon]
MHRPGWAWALALFLLLLLSPSVHAGVAVTGTATRVEVAGHADLAGPLRAWSHQEQACGSVRLVGTAASAHVEVDRSQVAYSAVGVAPLDADVTTEPSDLRDVRVLVNGTKDCRLVLIPLAPRSAEAQLAGLAVEAATAGTTTFKPHASTVRPQTTYEARGALAALGGREWSVRGDFRLVVWGADATFASANGTVTAETGQHSTPTVAPGVPVMENVQVEAYADLRGAELTLVLANATTALLEDASLAMAAGSVSLHSARLVVAGEAVAPATVVLRAPLAGALRAQSAAVRLELGDVAAIEGAGLEAADGPGLGALWPWWLAGLAVVALAATAYRHQRVLLRRRMDARDYPQAAATASRLAWLPWAGRDARVAEAVALLRSGQLARAERRLGPARRWARRRDTRDYLLAHLRSLQGRRGEALESLANCIAVSPGYARDAAADPALRGLVAEALRKAETRRAALVEGYV